MITRATVRLLLGSCISMWQYPLALRNKRPMRPEPVVTPTQLLGISHYSGWLWFIEIGWMQTSNHFEDLRVRLLQSSTSNGESAVSISMLRSTLLLWHECHLHCVARKLTCGRGASHCGFPWIWWIKNELIYEYVFFFIQALLLPSQPWLPAAEVWAVIEPVLFYFLLSSWTLEEGTWKKRFHYLRNEGSCIFKKCQTLV